MRSPTKLLRTIIFWSHLGAGLTAGVVILIMSATGAVLALKPQILNQIDRDVRTVQPASTPRLPISQVLAAAIRPDAAVTTVTVERNPTRAVAVAFERGGTMYANPYTGAVLGEGSARALGFFRTMDSWHRWVGLPADQRATAKGITGASNLAFLALAISGIYLWWPRKWTPQHTRAILAFKRTATARARDFNWHNVIGFWCAPVIIVMTLTATVMSYTWANNLLYRAAGSDAPSVNREAPRPAQSATRAERRPAAAALTAEQIDRAWTVAEGQMPTWSVVSMRLPNGPGPVSFTLTDGSHWNAFARSQLTVNAASGEIQRWQPYAASSPGAKARGWFRFAHTGELFGMTGQVIAGLACLGGVFLVWTGFSLAVRRFVNWRAWRRPDVRPAARDAA